MVSVDYETLARIIQQFLHTGIFRAKVADSRKRLGGHIELHVKEGMILYCFFVNTQGQREKWEQWEKRLTSLGVLDWEHESQHIPETPVPPLRNPTTPIAQSPVPPPAFVQHFSSLPYQVITLSPTQLAQLPQICRRVYFLVDGRRRYRDIALILQKPESDIAQAIDYLAQLGVVRIRS